MLTREKLIHSLRSEIPYLKEHFGVKKIALFGSFAKKSYTKKSDVDILIEFERPIGFRFIDLAEYLEKRLGRKTDILTKEGMRRIRVRKVMQDIKRSLRYV